MVLFGSTTGEPQKYIRRLGTLVVSKYVCTFISDVPALVNQQRNYRNFYLLRFVTEHRAVVSFSV